VKKRNLNPKIFLHVPTFNHDDEISLSLELNVGVELNFDTRWIDKFSDSELESIRSNLDKKEIPRRIHGPFMDLNPGSVDENIVTLTKSRVEKSIRVANILGANSIVFHNCFYPQLYGQIKEIWLQRAVPFWAEISNILNNSDVNVLLENHLENSPEIFNELLSRVNSPRIGICLDIGHANVYSSFSINRWIAELKPYLREAHIHDNHKVSDDHLAIGKGSIDGIKKIILELFACNDGLAFTVEVWNKEDAITSVSLLRQFLFGSCE